MNEVELLLERAASKLASAKVLLRAGYFDDAISRVAWGHSILDLLKALSRRAAVNDDLLHCARNLDKYYVPTRYPNGFESGSPYEYFTRRDAEDAIICSRRIIEFCKDLLA